MEKTNQLHAVMLKSQFFPLIVQCRTFRKHAFFFTDFIDLRVYIINHVSAEALATRGMIPSGTNSPPAEVSTQ